VLVGIQDAGAVPIAMDRAMRLPVEKMAGSGARIFFLTSPNAPTGVGFSNAEITGVLREFDGILVVDEAYAPFARENAAGLIAGHRNLVVLRTFSKAYALAGIRVGYALADPEVIALIDRVRDSYNVSRLSQVAALAALSDPGYYADIIDKIKGTRDFYVHSWRAFRGWFTFPSQSNFICTEPVDGLGRTGPAVARAAYDFLYSRKVLVRHFPSDALTAPFLRITVGSDDEMLVLDQNLDAWLKAPPNE
jgi:histidinol-phosphate aminotransferase